ncbi:hypothetical protein RR48_00179 [Papilio machaon]|uniref:Uncharacterized protein n=1 Tax=Papilio machaon TaxID=76193 RepID=A0A0N1IJC8_PAPMA|nr:hypothetical protein RR48_00179 [Papilio machaon]
MLNFKGSFTLWKVSGDRAESGHIVVDSGRVIDFFTTTPVPPDGAPLQEERPDTPTLLSAHTVNQVAAALVTHYITFYITILS